MAVYGRGHRHGENMAIFEDAENGENAGCRKAKVVDVVRAPLQDRTVSFQNSKKVQALKPSKHQVFGSENCGSKYYSQDIVKTSRDEKQEPFQKQFTIFEDVHSSQEQKQSFLFSTEEQCDDAEQMDLNPSVTGMFKPYIDSMSTVPVDVSVSDGTVVGEASMLDESMSSDEGVADTDTGVVNDKHLWFPEYKEDIYQYLRQAEVKHGVRADYMRKQVDITYSMRSILVDWMVEVAEEYKLDRETLNLSVCYVDRFLSLMAVARGKLQLVGAASMLIASKYEEIYPPEISEFVYITDNTYTKKQVLQMERMILRALSFDIASPTINWFCLSLLSDLNASERTTSLTMYLAELTMLDGEHFLRYLPSLTATCCVCLALQTLGYDKFMGNVMLSTGYSLSDLKSCLADLFTVFLEAPNLPHPAIREKFAKEKLNCVSLITPVGDLKLEDFS